MSNEIRLIIADDHPLLRHGLRKIIEKDPRMVVLAEADDGAEALRLIQTLKPDIAVLDVHMPEMTGFDVARAVSEERLATAVVILTMFKEEEMFNVDNHRTNISQKLGLHGTHALVKFALEHKSEL